MKTVGLICLILGILGAVKAVNVQKPRQGSEAYRSGYVAGRIAAPLVLIPLGLFLLLRNKNRKKHPASPLSGAPDGLPPRFAPATTAPHPIPVKIQCRCGQNYAFEVEPVAGQMPAPIACPACGADGTNAANAVIAQSLADTVQTLLHQPSKTAAGLRKMHPALIAGITVAAVVALLITVSFARQFSSRRRAMQFHEEAMRQFQPPNINGRGFPNGPGTGANPSQAGRPGFMPGPAPVPPDVTAVEAMREGHWWPATILRREGSRALVHYKGRDSSSDEWVTPDRLRPRP